MNQNDPKSISGTIMHVGAGDCPELEAYLSSRAERIILVEPEPDRAAALERRCAENPRVKVITAALAGETGEAELKVYNIRSVDGLREPEGLEEIYPGLRLRDQIVVPTLSPSKLMEAAGTLPAPVLLILEAPGVETEILKAWQADGSLAQIDRVELHCSAMKAFAGGSDATALRNLLKKCAFEEVSADFSDPDWPVLVMQQNPMRQEVEAQQVRIHELEQQLAKLQADHDAALAENIELTTAAKKAENKITSMTAAATARDARVDELREQLSVADTALKASEENAAKSLEALRDEAEAARKAASKAAASRDAGIAELETVRAEAETARKAATKAAASRDARIAELETVRAEAETARKAAAKAAASRGARIAELESAVEAKERARLNAAETFANKDARIQELKSQAAESKAAAEANQAALDAKQAALEAKHTELKARNAEVVTARSDLAVALRMQAILQSDLRDLQTRYQESSSTRQQQEDLLRKLTPRLQEAARQIQEMSALQSNEAPGLAHAKTAKPRGRRPKALPGE